MHLYWRVLEELKFLGETWTIHHPGLLRCYRAWLQKNAGAIALSDSKGRSDPPILFGHDSMMPSLN